MFKNGLGATPEEIEAQVQFIGDEYGGVAGFRKALELTPLVAHSIYRNRTPFVEAAVSAPNILEGTVLQPSIRTLFTPFQQEILGKRNWLVWAGKFWHFLNPDAFIIPDSRVFKCFGLTGDQDPLKKYTELMERYR